MLVPDYDYEIPESTVQIAKAAFPKGVPCKNLVHAKITRGNSKKSAKIGSSHYLGFLPVIYYLFSQILSLNLTFFRLLNTTNLEKDIEILFLRQQLQILKRKENKRILATWPEKLSLTILGHSLLKDSKTKFETIRGTFRLFQPATILKWHQNLVKRKWTYNQINKGGRPRVSTNTRDLILRLAQENSRWGYGKIQGELTKLGFKVSQSTVRNVLQRHNITPAPVRAGSIGWKEMMKHYKDQIIACDFFAIETIFLKTIYVFFFIELGTRRIHLAGITANPNGCWVAQQARQLVWNLEESKFKILIRDNDRKYSAAFDHVFESEGIRVVPTPIGAPNANAFAERWVRTVREECLDHILILNEHHLKRVLKEYVAYYEKRRPHQGLNQSSPVPFLPVPSAGKIEKRTVLGGMINDYYRESIQAISLAS